MGSPIAENLAAIKERMATAARRAGRDPAEVRLLAVSKTKPVSDILQALAAGQVLFGENYVQEALDKQDQIAEGAQWHMIGHLQRNKARHIPGRFKALETLDTPKLAHALQSHAQAAGAVLEVFIQVNLSGEATKSGISDEGLLKELVETVQQCSALELKGLMSIPDPSYSEAETRKLYAKVRELQQRLKAEFALGEGCNALSMGMSHDFEWAIEEGATLVRVGSAIFGARS